ncbi:MAG: DHH family phosphoesterase [Pirellulaceae bacterium]
MMKVLRSTRLLNALAGYEQVLVVTHDNPDPDAIASGWALRWLIHERLAKTARLIGGGAIIRAENRHMVKLLSPPIELVEEIAVDERTATILVDCSSSMSNHLLCSCGLQPIAVIDHHQIHGPRQRLVFRDIRPHVAASATIVASYLKDEHLEPSHDLATALLYGIQTETQGSETHYSPLDRRMVTWLVKYADPGKLAEIGNAPLPPEYFSDLVLALQSTFAYDEAAICFLPRAEGPETVGEVADLLVRCEGIQKVLCGGEVGEDLFISVRTDREAGNATELVQQVLAGLGLGGGHEHRAGGRIRLGQCPLNGEQLTDELRNRWLAACGSDRQRGTRLVARREIVKNL